MKQYQYHLDFYATIINYHDIDIIAIFSNIDDHDSNS